MRKLKKKLKKPRKPWDKERIEREKEIIKKFGLRRKREIWKAESILRNFRRRARELAASGNKEEEKTLLEKLSRMGLLKNKAGLSDVLGLNVESIIERRLQTIVFKKGLANSPKHARQFITHGHIAIDGRRTIYPSYLIPVELEKKISFYKKPLSKKGG